MHPATTIRQIPLNNSKYAIVDCDDFDRVSKHNWQYHSQGYASSKIDGKTVLMHQMIVNAPGMDIDHINHDKTDNRKENLRVCTRSQNKANVSKKKGKFTSKYKGVDWRSDMGKWRATIRVNYKKIHLGMFETEEAAAKAYDKAALEYFKEFAFLNFQGGI